MQSNPLAWRCPVARAASVAARIGHFVTLSLLSWHNAFWLLLVQIDAASLGWYAVSQSWRTAKSVSAMTRYRRVTRKVEKNNRNRWKIFCLIYSLHSFLNKCLSQVKKRSKYLQEPNITNFTFFTFFFFFNCLCLMKLIFRKLLVSKMK